jgi:hypothetical protein
MYNSNQFGTVRVVGGKFKDTLKGQRGVIDHSIGDGSVVVTFKHGAGDDAKSESYILAASSVAAAKVMEKPIAEQRAEIEPSIGLRPGFGYV